MSSIMFRMPSFSFKVPLTPPPSTKVRVFSPASFLIVVVPCPKISLSKIPEIIKLELFVISEPAPVAKFSAKEINSPPLITTFPTITPLLSVIPLPTFKFPLILPLF